MSKNGSYSLVLAEISPDKGDAILLLCLWFQIAKRSADRGRGPVDDIGQSAFCGRRFGLFLSAGSSMPANRPRAVR